MRKIIFLLFFIGNVCATDNQRIFPLNNYNQDTKYWLNPQDAGYTNSLLIMSYQTKRLDSLKHRYFGTASDDVSPWSPDFIQSLINQHNAISAAEVRFLSEFDNTKISNPNKLGYASNKRLYSPLWIKNIRSNLNLPQFIANSYNKSNRAIAVNNLLVRVLPTDDPFYYNDKIPGEGYPFDNLQNSAIYAGTPLYIMGRSVDSQWMLVFSPDIAGWVHTDNVAVADDAFIAKWQDVAYKTLAGITENNLAVKDNQDNYLFSAYIGTILPLLNQDKLTMTVLVAVKNSRRMAEIKVVKLPVASSAVLPIPASMANFAKILQVMQQRVYGWGNLGMYNDCSSELKNIYALFGLYVPRNTKSIDNAGKMIDLSSKSVNGRLTYLMQNSTPLLTFIHINGHVVLYIGKYAKNYSNSNHKPLTAYPLVYQQVWGLRDVKQSYRLIIGQSVFFPLLDSYKEDQNIVPQASFSMFRLIDLSQEPDKNYKPDLQELLY